MNFLKRLTDELNAEHLGDYRFGYDVEFVNFFNDLCIIRKK